MADVTPQLALSYAIFALNTLAHPDASSATDVADLDAHSDAALTQLANLRMLLEWVDVSTLHEKCVHCHLFVEANDDDDVENGAAEYVHLSRGDAADERFEDHEAGPSGLIATLDTWRIFGPSAMRERFVTRPEGT